MLICSATYKQFDLKVIKLENPVIGGYQPHVVVRETGEPMSEVLPGLGGKSLTNPQFIPFAQYVTLGEAQEKASQEATMRADDDGIAKSSTESGIEWHEPAPN